MSAVACLARAEALDRLHVEGAVPFRVAADEVLLLSNPGQAVAVAASASAQLGPGAVVVDQTDGFVGWTLCGENVLEAFCRLSALPLDAERPNLRQGLVAHLPAKVIAANGTIHLLVPSTLGHHLRQRVHDACADLDLIEANAAAFKSTTALQIVA